MIKHMLLKVIDKGRKEAERSTASMRRLYVLSADRVYRNVEADLIAVRREMFQRKIKVQDDPKPEYAVHYLYVIDGFSAQVGMFAPAVRQELGRLLGKYIDSMFDNILTH